MHSNVTHDEPHDLLYLCCLSLTTMSGVL